MDAFDRDRLADDECAAVFRRLFPLGFAGQDVVAEIAPEGWKRSPPLAVFHEALEAAKDRPPPATVEAYRHVYRHLPNGWPPWE